MSSTDFVSLSLSLVISSASMASTFSHTRINAKIHRVASPIELMYRLLQHGPDIEHLSDMGNKELTLVKWAKIRFINMAQKDFTQYLETTPN